MKGGSFRRRMEERGKKMLSVRELAIQPTQRVTRYVLQYRGALSLLKHRIKKEQVR